MGRPHLGGRAAGAASDPNACTAAPSCNPFFTGRGLPALPDAVGTAPYNRNGTGEGHASCVITHRRRTGQGGTICCAAPPSATHAASADSPYAGFWRAHGCIMLTTNPGVCPCPVCSSSRAVGQAHTSPPSRHARPLPASDATRPLCQQSAHFFRPHAKQQASSNHHGGGEQQQQHVAPATRPSDPRTPPHPTPMPACTSGGPPHGTRGCQASRSRCAPPPHVCKM